jgi:hypothetical protein
MVYCTPKLLKSLYIETGTISMNCTVTPSRRVTGLTHVITAPPRRELLCSNGRWSPGHGGGQARHRGLPRLWQAVRRFPGGLPLPGPRQKAPPRGPVPHACGPAAAACRGSRGRAAYARTKKESRTMYDIHPDLLVAFERVRQAHLQHQTTLQRLGRPAPLSPPSPRGRWTPPGRACWRRLGRRLHALVHPSSRPHPVVLAPPG